MSPEEIAKYGEPLFNRSNCVCTKTHRRCNICLVWLPHDKFGKDKHDPIGVYSKCKLCCSAKGKREYKQGHGKKVKEKRKAVEAKYGKLISYTGDCKTTVTHKYCPDCKQWKLHSNFHKKVSDAAGISGTCKSCAKKKSRGHYLKSSYNLTIKEYETLLLSQNRKRAICGSLDARTKHKDRTQKLFVDHDHITGEVRGLLCHFCNIAIGMLQDDPKLLERAAKYLRDSK